MLTLCTTRILKLRKTKQQFSLNPVREHQQKITNAVGESELRKR